jgi:lipopolysaccharide transport system permease protein
MRGQLTAVEAPDVHSRLRQRLGYHWDLLAVLVSKEMKLRYRGTLLGVLWSLANPLALTLVLYIAFRRVLQVQIENYPLFVLPALFMWQWLSNSLSAAASLFTMNAQLIRKLPGPRIALCIAVVTSDLIHFAVTIPIYLALALFVGSAVLGWELALGLLILLLLQTLFILGCIIVIATLNALLRDVEQLVRVGLLLLFYVSPVLYPMSMVPQRFHWVFLLNPLTPFVAAWRSLLMEGQLSSYLPLCLLYGVTAFALGMVVYRRTGWRLAEVV